jgi:hypothetical protein
MAGEVLNYLRDPRLGGREAVARVLRRCHAALQPDGLLLFDVRVVPRGRRPLLREVFHEGEDWAVAARVEVDPSRRRLIREVTVFRRRGRSFRRSREHHEVRLYDGAELSRALRRAGFAVRRLGGYAGLRFGSDQAGFLARRR